MDDMTPISNRKTPKKMSQMWFISYQLKLNSNKVAEIWSGLTVLANLFLSLLIAIFLSFICFYWMGFLLVKDFPFPGMSNIVLLYVGYCNVGYYWMFDCVIIL